MSVTCCCIRGFDSGDLPDHPSPQCPIHGPFVQDPVNHPSHYGGADNQYEAIKVIEAWGLGFHLGNAIKYICRAGKKSSHLEDLQKARWYLDRAITQLEGNRDD